MSTTTPDASTFETKVQDFLAQRRIAVVGVSPTRDITGNLIYRKLKGAGYQVFPIHPKAETFDGDPCYPDLKAIPGGVDGVMIVTQPAVAETVVRQCAEAGVKRVWMHQSLAKSATSVSPEAVAYCRSQGISVIDGACPMMFCDPVDFGHKCMRWIMRVTGGMPK